jgi:hypothetical protein
MRESWVVASTAKRKLTRLAIILFSAARGLI